MNIPITPEPQAPANALFQSFFPAKNSTKRLMTQAKNPIGMSKQVTTPEASPAMTAVE